MGKKTEKFLFNQHIFDEPEDDEDEFEEPPPPTFSEEELETVRKTTHDRAFQLGKQEGIAETKASIDAQVAQVLQKISHDTALIFAAESERDKTFERESVLLASAIFEKIFPEQKNLHGFDELKASLTTILRKQENQSQIRIEVHPSTVDGIQNHIKQMNLHAGNEKRFDIVGNESLGELAVNIYWKDGGAIRDVDAIAGEIKTILHETLAGEPLNSHDSSISADAEDLTTAQTPQDPDPPEIQTGGTETALESGSARHDSADENEMTDKNMEKPDE